MDPTLFLNGELDALLRRLLQVDATKWQALAELGLKPIDGASFPQLGEGRRAP